MFYQICLFHLSKVLYFPLPSTFPFQLYCYFFTYKSIYSLEGQFSNLKEVLTSSLTLHVVTFKLANFITFCLYSRVYELLSVLKQQPFHCHVIMFDYWHVQFVFSSYKSVLSLHTVDSLSSCGNSIQWDPECPYFQGLIFVFQISIFLASLSLTILQNCMKLFQFVPQNITSFFSLKINFTSFFSLFFFFNSFCF